MKRKVLFLIRKLTDDRKDKKKRNSSDIEIYMQGTYFTCPRWDVSFLVHGTITLKCQGKRLTFVALAFKKRFRHSLILLKFPTCRGVADTTVHLAARLNATRADYVTSMHSPRLKATAPWRSTHHGKPSMKALHWRGIQGFCGGGHIPLRINVHYLLSCTECISSFWA